MLGDYINDDKEVNILGRVVRWTSQGTESEADPKHRKLVLESFGLNEVSMEVLSCNWERDEEEQHGDELELDERGAL